VGGVRSSPIGDLSPINGKLLFLQGYGRSELGPPQSVCLPVTVPVLEDRVVMTDIQFKVALTTKGERYTYSILPRNQVTESERMLQFAPIPAYLIYDGFETDLDTALVYEQIICHCTGGNDIVIHLKHFLRSCDTAHNTGDANPCVDTAVLSSAPLTHVRMWAKEKITICFPTLCTAPTPLVSMPDCSSTKIERLLTQVLVKIAGSSFSVLDLTSKPPAPEKKSNSKISMSSSELRDTLIMCGKCSSGDTSLLPVWIQDCALKGTSEAYKLAIICKWIMMNDYYNDATVPLTAPLIKMVQKRMWVGKEGNTSRQSIIHAIDGLSSFFMLDFLENEVASINDEEDLLNQASLVSVKYLRLFRRRIIFSVPELAEEFMLVLKRYANLLFVVFTQR